MNLEKIKNLINKKSFPFIVLTIIALLLIFFSFSFFTQRERIKELETQIIKLEQELTLYKALPMSQIGQEEFRPGEVGEVKQDEVPEGILPLKLPPMISNTEGTIIEIKEDRLIVQGSGTNFTDQQPRELILLFTRETIVFEPGQRVKHQGLEGLKHLKQGDEISISSPENIRGKTLFKVGTINKIVEW